MKAHGRILVKQHGSSSVFEEQSFSYPLKLLSPRIDTDSKAALSYILGYGGGLVSGDNIQLNVHVETNASLLLLTQVLLFGHR
jgi:urease accessory protein